MAKPLRMTPEEAASLIKDGDTIIIAEFFQVGLAGEIVKHIKAKNLTVITNDTGVLGAGTDLILEQIDEIILSYVATNPRAAELIEAGKLKVTMIPQDILIGKLRATAEGHGGFWTRTGVGTEIAEGKRIEIFPDEKEYALEMAFFPKPKFALVRAHMADELGNFLCTGTAANFNPVAAAAAETAIVQVDTVVEKGRLFTLGLHELYVPFNYASKKILVECYGAEKISPWKHKKQMGQAKESHVFIAKRIAKELKKREKGTVVNFGIGIPSLAADFLSEEDEIYIQIENGFLGVGKRPEPGKEDPYFINAAGEPITGVDGSSSFDSVSAFGQITGGRVEIAVLGALQVVANFEDVKKTGKADIANWGIPGKSPKGYGGGPALAAGAEEVWVGMEHCILKNNNGTEKVIPKIISERDFPLTAVAVVTKIFTELCVIEMVKGEGPVLREIASGVSIEEVKEKTGTELIIPDDIKGMGT